MIRVTQKQILSGVYGRIVSNADSAFTQALSGGEHYYVYERPEEEKPPYPYAVANFVSGVDSGAILYPVTEVEWQMNCFAPKASDSAALADACIELFENEQIVISSKCETTCMFNVKVGPMHGGDEEPFQTVVTFSLYA